MYRMNYNNCENIYIRESGSLPGYNNREELENRSCLADHSVKQRQNFNFDRLSGSTHINK